MSTERVPADAINPHALIVPRKRGNGRSDGTLGTASMDRRPSPTRTLGMHGHRAHSFFKWPRARPSLGSGVRHCRLLERVQFFLQLFVAHPRNLFLDQVDLF